MNQVSTELISLRLSSIHQAQLLRSLSMNFLVEFTSSSILSLSTLILFLTGLTAHAETPTAKIAGWKRELLPPQSDSASEIAQTTIQIEPGRATRSGSSYLGLGGNIGLDGNTSVGDGALALISKIGLTNSFSFRPSAFISDDLTFLLSFTFDFFGQPLPEADTRIAPYLGGGLSLDTGEGDTVGLLLSAGLDIPLSANFTANTALNVKFLDDTAVGLVLGVGYNF